MARHWFVVFNGIADRWLGPFETDRWRLTYNDPALGLLGIEPLRDCDPPATLEDARWLADALAYDHDAPVGITPAWAGEMPDRHPIDPAAAPPSAPIGADADAWTTSAYWDDLNASYGAAAALRFADSYVLRYGDGAAPPATDFTARFQGREELVGLYAMAARQADLLTEYLCLYRILEAADGTNGTVYAASRLADVGTADFGELPVIVSSLTGANVNAFDVYRARAQEELLRLANAGVPDVPRYLYEIRNSLAHGKHDILTPADSTRFVDAARALPVVKLLARLAVEQ
jgi:hypothetical protein